MPTYDYECSKCGYTFEAFQKISDDPLTVCPKCGGPVKRLIGGGLGIIFKGSGFYTTDYKRSSINSSSANSGSANTGGNGNGKEVKETSPHKEKKTETKAVETKE